MHKRVILPLIGSNIVISICIATTLWLSATDVVNDEEEIRDALLQIACQEYYSSSSEEQRLFLSMIIQDLVKQEKIADMSEEDLNRAVEHMYWNLLDKLDEYLPSWEPHENK
jgi:hypothetical protein